MMAAVGARAARHARAVSQAGTFRDRLDQLADAMHDEGDLRAVPAAARGSGDGQDDATCSPASTRTSRSTVDWAALDERLRQNSVQEKLTAQWIDHCLVKLGKREMQRVVNPACLTGAARTLLPLFRHSRFSTPPRRADELVDLRLADDERRREAMMSPVVRISTPFS